MAESLRLYLRYFGISFRSQTEYRASFVMLVLAHFLTSGLEIVMIWALFSRFRSLGGWRLEEIALLYGIVNVAFAVTEGVTRGFDTFSNLVRSGDFDRLLLRPRSTALQVAASEVQLIRIGRLLQGAAVLVWAASRLDVRWTAPRVGLLLGAVAGGACLFGGVFILQAVLSFWSTETLEIVNTISYGGTEAGEYPLPIYRRWFRDLFTFVVPLGCVTYFPALAILGRKDAMLGSPAWFHWLSPVAGFLFLVISLQAWRFGVRHYTSTGS